MIIPYSATHSKVARRWGQLHRGVSITADPGSELLKTNARVRSKDWNTVTVRQKRK